MNPLFSIIMFLIWIIPWSSGWTRLVKLARKNWIWILVGGGQLVYTTIEALVLSFFIPGWECEEVQNEEICTRRGQTHPYYISSSANLPQSVLNWAHLFMSRGSYWGSFTVLNTITNRMACFKPWEPALTEAWWRESLTLRGLLPFLCSFCKENISINAASTLSDLQLPLVEDRV